MSYSVINNGYIPLLAHVAIALGWFVHVALVPTISASDLVLESLTQTTETLGLGKMVVEMDGDKTIQIYIDYIEQKWQELGLK